MSRETLASNQYMTLEYLADKKMLYHTIHQPVREDPDMFKEVLNIGTEALTTYGISKWLSDDRNNGPVGPEITDWGESYWYKATIEAGWKYWANVVPLEVQAAGSLMPIIQHLSERGLRLRVFTDVEDAITWLDSKPNE